MRGTAKLAILSLGVVWLAASSGSASAADACKSYTKANYKNATCDISMMPKPHKAVHHKAAMKKK